MLQLGSALAAMATTTPYNYIQGNLENNYLGVLFISFDLILFM